ncbi:gamma-glutamyl-gamma-aminobutyrate hydrolase family protein [Yunchengibacter salinarum]|uniref:gamma-glutamyl-gamma-aminobutyrate hydrolase family protein n=1 Tax=Yunchengibacter salinarum TaxID=3133399 RepID=UPI0035B67B0A
MARADEGQAPGNPAAWRGSRPRIGVTTSEYKSRIAWWCDWLAVWRAGGAPVRITPARRVDPATLAGLVVGGGDDIGATLYGGELTVDVRLDPDRDALELDLLQAFDGTGKPVLGICRGAQMMNVHYGGTLHHDISEKLGVRNPPRTVMPLRTIRIVEESRLHGIVRRRQARINSLHHQAMDRIGDGLTVVARDRDRIVQAIERSGERFMVGVQWHPEFLIFDRAQQRLFRALVAAARERVPAPNRA